MPLPPIPPSAVPADGDFTALANAACGGFERTLGLVFTSVGFDRVEAELPVKPALYQPYGLVHGGVYASIVETLCATGAAVNAIASGRSSLGVENNTSFLRGVRSGTLSACATPLHKGHRTQVWRCEVADDSGRLVATGRVRMLVLEEGGAVAGEGLAMHAFEKG